MKTGWVKKTCDAKSRRGMNKGTGFGPKNKPSLLCNGKGEGELAGSKKRCKEGPCPPLKAVFLTQEESDARTQRCFCILDSAYSVQCQKFRAKISISAWRRTVQIFEFCGSTRLFLEMRREHRPRQWRAGLSSQGSEPGKAPSQRQRWALLTVREIERAQPQRGGTYRQSLGSIQPGEHIQSHDT